MFRLGTFTGGSFRAGRTGPRRRLGPLPAVHRELGAKAEKGDAGHGIECTRTGPEMVASRTFDGRLQLLQYVPTGPHGSAERRSSSPELRQECAVRRNKVPGVSRSQPGRSREQYEMSTDGRFLRRHARRHRIGSPQDLIMSRSVVASCSPWLPFDAEINGCLERGARKNAGRPCRRT